MRRGLWLVLAAPPLLAWLVLAVLTFNHAPRQVRTGDKFVDAIVQAACERYGVKHYTGYEPLLDAGQWTALEQQFSNDPRYWWLRFYCPDPSAGRQERDYAALAEARRRGCAGLPLLLVLYRQINDELFQSIPNADFPVLPERPTPADRAQFIHARRRTADRLGDTRPGELLAELRAIAPTHPLPLYLAALAAGERGQLDEARRLLAEGNRLAEQLRTTGADPAAALAPCSLGAATAADPLLLKLLPGLNDIGKRVIADDQLGWSASSLAYDALQQQRYDIVDELHIMCCNIAYITGYKWYLTKLVIQVQLSLQEQSAAQPAVQRDAVKLAALSDLRQRLDAAYVDVFPTIPAGPPPSPLPSWAVSAYDDIDRMLAKQLDKYSGGYYEPANNVLGIYSDRHVSWLAAGIDPMQTQKLARQMSGLLAFDYTTCTFDAAPQDSGR